MWTAQIESGLTAYERRYGPLPGVPAAQARLVLVQQLIDSIHRVQFVRTIAERSISPLRIDPDSKLFDPLRAAILVHRGGDTDEAFWLVFLATHCGRNGRTGWLLAGEIYAGDGRGRRWTWARVIADRVQFRRWLAINASHFGGKFGNHRKYESLRDDSDRGTGAVVESYIRWVAPPRTHEGMIDQARAKVGDDRGEVFDHLYNSMSMVMSFGRTARFDYLTMLGKIGLAEIEPNSPYIVGSTGPYTGGRLLFGGSVDAKLSREEVEARIVRLGTRLGLGMQILEDALCNWQKSPKRYARFRG